ncbi:glycosyltransferase family 4 protein [Jiella avicenniae]|uniref:Glycosyltransferase family 4 protein n=1 Tax=Jiella avicenniae TaxID=2907202 RepID=A0A9X1P3S3_9HYPH|nr:glycosyltransferase family 4 protein [Jiella avicenniae]MCE7030847.1 glycosyltransferase family 4 protein [Jiella avicenniae]
MNSLAILWDNFGPMHDDRVRAVARRMQNGARVVGVEIFGSSETYEWESGPVEGFDKRTLFPGGSFSGVSVPRTAAEIIRECRKLGAEHVFFCHYERPAVLLAASILRLSGCRVYTMSCSKFDDYERSVGREWLKRIFFLPYHGAISSGLRARDYMRLMGIPKERIATEYNTLSIDRIRRLSGKLPAPDGLPFADRHFTIVARFVPKKNLAMALEGYALYRREAENPRPLHLCGSGPLEEALREQVQSLGLTDHVVFRGFLQTDGIAQVLGDTLTLLLPSVEEQFGNVVIEAQAMGLPVILSDNCGARDNLVRSGVNGFVIEPDSPQGLAFFMRLLDRDESLWRRMSLAASASAERGDAARFAEAVQQLIEVR